MIHLNSKEHMGTAQDQTEIKTSCNVFDRTASKKFGKDVKTHLDKKELSKMRLSKIRRKNVYER